MALIKCPECQTQVSSKAVSCPSCGCPISKFNNTETSGISYKNNQDTLAISIRKSRGIHIILGLLFGGIGINNFYTGHNVRGGIKFGIITLALMIDATTGFHSKFSLIFLAVFGIWTLIEIITIDRDAAGNKMT